MDTVERITNQIKQNPVLLYMKGTPQFPMCGFSSQVSNILQILSAKFAYVNILENPHIRSELPVYANWPTFPQLYVNGELIGGCDIIIDMHEQGTLTPTLKQANAILENARPMFFEAE